MRSPRHFKGCICSPSSDVVGDRLSFASCTEASLCGLGPVKAPKETGQLTAQYAKNEKEEKERKHTHIVHAVIADVHCVTSSNDTICVWCWEDSMGQFEEGGR